MEVVDSPSSLKRRWWQRWSRRQWLIGGLMALAIVGALTWARLGFGRFMGSINELHVDLSKPDAYILTPSLSALPKDLVKAPIARDLLTEEFAFYYEDHEDKLGVRGAIKRLAFERDVKFTDQLLSYVLNEPAEIAFWADAKGAPRHWMIAMTEGKVAQALQGLGKLAADEKQLTVIDSVSFGGSSLDVYALQLSSRRTLAFVSKGNRLVVMSHPGLLFDADRGVDRDARKVIEQLLSADEKDQAIYRQRFGVQASSAQHTMVGDAHWLSMGYQDFFTGVKAFRIDVKPDGGPLSTYLRVDSLKSLPTTSDRQLWAGLPANPAACAVMPMDWAMAAKVLENAEVPSNVSGAETAWKSMAQGMQGSAAVCWYAKSQLHTPLFMSRIKPDTPGLEVGLSALSTWLAPSKAKPVTSMGKAGGPNVKRWQQEVAGPWASAKDVNAAYHPTLSYQAPWVGFSPDDALVSMGLDAQARRFPNVADTLPADSLTLGVVVPKQMADLAQREAMAVLTNNQEGLRQAIQSHLVPRLDALRRLPPTRIVAEPKPDANGWVAVKWLPMVNAR